MLSPRRQSSPDHSSSVGKDLIVFVIAMVMVMVTVMVMVMAMVIVIVMVLRIKILVAWLNLSFSKYSVEVISLSQLPNQPTQPHFPQGVRWWPKKEISLFFLR